MIYLVRHGETVFNAEGRFQGHADSPLTPRGEAQAHEAGRLLRDLRRGEEGWRIVSSPLGRARRTTEIIAQIAGLEAGVSFDPRLKEISLGSWDGLTRTDIEARNGFSGFSAPKGPKWWFLAPDGESYETFSGRISAWLEEAVKEAGTVVVVSHGGAGRLLRGLYLGLDREATFALDTPQNCLFRLWRGQIDRLEFPEEGGP